MISIEILTSFIRLWVIRSTAKRYDLGMGVERFKCGYPEGIESLMAGKARYGEKFEDVTKQILHLKRKQRDQLILLVACDRIYGFFEQRGGVANGPLLNKMVRDLLGQLEITPPEPPLKLRGGRGSYDVSSEEARQIYDELVKTGILEVIGGLGAKNVFCTVWNYINESLGY